MGARCRLQCDCAVLTAIRRDALPVIVDDFSVAAPDGSQRAALGTGKSIANQVIRVIRVLLDVVPGAADFPALDGEEIGPWAIAFEDGLAGHHACERPESDAVAGIAGARKLMSDLFS